MKKNDCTHRVLLSDGVIPEMIEYRSETLGETYYRMNHRSGLPILVFPKKMTACVAMMVVRYGSQDFCFLSSNNEVITTPEGVAHFLEHKLFTEEDGSTVDEVLSALGVDVNAWTACDKTAYYVSATSHYEQAIGHLLRFVTHPYFTKESVEKEQGIIAQEIRMVEDNPWETLYRKTMGALYPSHPIRRSICGTEASIARITEKTLYDCYTTFYRPENMYLAVCGDISPRAVAGVADCALADWKSRLPSDDWVMRRLRTMDTSLPQGAVVRTTANVARPLLQIAWKDDVLPTDPSQRLRRELAMGVLSEILFSRAGLFYNRLFESGILSPTYYYGYSSMRDLAYHSISCETDEPEAVMEEYKHFITEQKREGIRCDDFERCRRVLYAGYVSEFDFTDDIADLMIECEGNDCDVFESAALIDALTLEEIQQLLQDSFDERSTACTVLTPLEQEEE